MKALKNGHFLGKNKQFEKVAGKTKKERLMQFGWMSEKSDENGGVGGEIKY